MDELKQELLRLIEGNPGSSRNSLFLLSEQAVDEAQCTKALRELFQDGLIRRDEDGAYERVESQPEATEASADEPVARASEGTTAQPPSFSDQALAIMDEPRTNDDLVRMLGLTSKQATNVITRLRAAGKVVPCGWKGRKQLYALNDDKTHEVAPRSPSPSPSITAIKVPTAEAFKATQHPESTATSGGKSLSAADLAFTERLRAQERESRALLRQYVEQIDDVTLSALIAATDAAIEARESWEKTHAD